MNWAILLRYYCNDPSFLDGSGCVSIVLLGSSLDELGYYALVL